jgi:4-amino-4-deoxy-L-arabinose transferase-like glycosyltransferase
LLAALLLLAVALRLVAAWAVPIVETDGVRFIELARRFQDAGTPFDVLFHPLYPALIGLAQPLVGDWELTGRLVSTAAGGVLLLPAFALARSLFGRDVAYLTAAMLAVHPGLVRSSASVLADSTYAALLVTAVWLGWPAVSRAGGRLVAAAGVLGAAYLVRPEAVLYLAALLGLAAIMAARTRDWRARTPWIAGAMAAFLLTAGPYLLFLRRALGHWTLSGKVAHNLVQDLGPTVAAAPLGHPVVLLRHVAENAFLFQKYALPELLPGLLALFLIPGLMAHGRTAGWLRREGVLLALALPPFVTLAFHVEARVFLPVVAFPLMVVAAGVVAAVRWLSDGAASRGMTAAVAATILALLVPATLAPVVRPDRGAAVYRDAARFIAATDAVGAVLLDRKPFVAFYSGRRHAHLADIEPAMLRDAARRAGARLIVLDSRALVDRPSLLPLVWAPPPPGFSVVRDFEAVPGDRLRLLAPIEGAAGPGSG